MSAFRRGCVCGGGLIVGPFGGSEERDEPALADALVEFLRRGGPRDEGTIKAWVALRDDLALTAALAHLLEAGEVDVVGADAAGEPLFAGRAAPRGN